MRRHEKTHWRDPRMYLNAGMNFPACYAEAKLLDLDKARLRTVTDVTLVTCQRCLREAARRKARWERT